MLLVEGLLGLIAFLLGAALFSFMNVVAWRLPRGKNPLTGRSFCPQCGAALTAGDLVPVFSWLFLRGRCRHCRAPIPVRYLLVELLGGVLAYFVSGHALKPLHSFAAQVEKVEPNNLTDMKITEEVLPEFRQFSRSFNQMLERLNNAFAAQRQFTGNAAHELRTPLALMQAQLELFSAEHPDMLPETAKFLTLLREQTERLTQMTKTLLEMSNLQQVARNEQIQLIPMIEEIFTDLAPLAEKRSITLEAEGDGSLTGSDTLIYRLLFNLTENAVKYNRPGGSVRVELAQRQEKCIIRVSDTGCGIPEEYQQSIFQPFFRVDKSRSREYGGVGLGLSLVWEIAALHGGSVWVEESSDKGTTIAVELPTGAESDPSDADIP